MPYLETLQQQRVDVCLAHMHAENAHEFPQCIAAFAHPRYELVPTGEIYDGPAGVAVLLEENRTAFPDFHFDVDAVHPSDAAVIVEGTFRGTHEGTWRGLPATGRHVEVPMAIIFRFEGQGLVGERVFFDLTTVLRQLGVARDPNTTSGKIMTLLNHPLTFGRALLRRLGTRAR
jgi:steroid delta-isomerase-like uncharacterized protein